MVRLLLNLSPLEHDRVACISASCIELWAVKYCASSMGINTDRPRSSTLHTCSAKANASFLKVVSPPTFKSIFTSGLVSSCLEILSSLEPARRHLRAVRWQNLTPGHCRWDKFDRAFPGDSQCVHRRLSQAHSLAQMQSSWIFINTVISYLAAWPLLAPPVECCLVIYTDSWVAESPPLIQDLQPCKYTACIKQTLSSLYIIISSEVYITKV